MTIVINVNNIHKSFKNFESFKNNNLRRARIPQVKLVDTYIN